MSQPAETHVVLCKHLKKNGLYWEYNKTWDICRWKLPEADLQIKVKKLNKHLEGHLLPEKGVLHSLFMTKPSRQQRFNGVY